MNAEIPTPSGIEKIVCDDISERQQKGITKYGATVADNPLELKAWLFHAYEESLDQSIYLRRAIAELDKVQCETVALRAALVKIAIGGDDEGTFTALELCRIARAAVPDWAGKAV